MKQATAAREQETISVKNSTLFNGSTEKTFRVLHAFDHSSRALPISEIAHMSGLDRSATQRAVYTLESLGYLKRVGQSKNYLPTSRLLQFGLNFLRSNDLVEKSAPYLLDVSRETGETVNLHELDDTEIVFVARYPGRHLINVDIMVGSRLPAYFTASGTAILSRLSQTEREDILERTKMQAMTPFTTVDPERLRTRVQEAAELGFALNMNETVMGDISVAAAITDQDGRAVAGLNISVPTTRWTLERVRAELSHHVQVAATSISMSKFGSYGHPAALRK